MKKLIAVLTLISVSTAAVGASALIFDERSSLGLTKVSSKTVGEEVEERYAGTLCLVAAELRNDTGGEKTLIKQSYEAGSLKSDFDPDNSFKQGNDMVVRLTDGEATALLDTGRAGDNIFINGDPQVPLTVGMTFDTSGTTDCAKVELEVSVRKTMQDLKVRKTMQELKVRKTMQDLKVTMFKPDGTPVRSLLLPEVDDEVIVSDTDGTIDLSVSLLSPIAMERAWVSEYNPFPEL